jgi:hypothetical protein
MRQQLTGLMLAFGVIGMGDHALAPSYVPGQIRDGFYTRPHFVSAPKPDRAGAPEKASPLLVPEPRDRNQAGEDS